ncbi:MAG: hypothetical protein PWQ63_724 [Methanolobus sp.]|nr:hypothetical protein [Methanolobus sp.]
MSKNNDKFIQKRPLSIDSNASLTDEINSIVRFYNTTTIMPQIISDDVINKLKNEDYTGEETKLLCDSIIEKYDKLAHGIMAMVDWMVVSYYHTDIMPLVVSKDLIEKLENNQFTDEEIELLYIALTKRYDRLVEP